jgi:hypothetical protein
LAIQLQWFSEYLRFQLLLEQPRQPLHEPAPQLRDPVETVLVSALPLCTAKVESARSLFCSWHVGQVAGASASRIGRSLS